MKLIQERDSLTFALQIVSRVAMNQRPAASSPTNTSNNDTISPGEVSLTPCNNTRPEERTDQNEWQVVSKSKKKRKGKTQKQRNERLVQRQYTLAEKCFSRIVMYIPPMSDSSL